MCKKVDCEQCEKPTWKGCGKHIEEALKDVPEEERCKCPRDSAESTVTIAKNTDETKVETATTTTTSEETKKVETTADAEVKTAETKEKTD